MSEFNFYLEFQEHYEQLVPKEELCLAIVYLYTKLPKDEKNSFQFSEPQVREALKKAYKDSKTSKGAGERTPHELYSRNLRILYACGGVHLVSNKSS